MTTVSTSGGTQLRADAPRRGRRGRNATAPRHGEKADKDVGRRRARWSGWAAPSTQRTEQAAATTHGARHGAAREERGPRELYRERRRGVSVLLARSGARAPAAGRGVHPRRRRRRVGGEGGMPFVASPHPTACQHRAWGDPSGRSVDGQRSGRLHQPHVVARDSVPPAAAAAPRTVSCCRACQPAGRLGPASPPTIGAWREPRCGRRRGGRRPQARRVNLLERGGDLVVRAARAARVQARQSCGVMEMDDTTVRSNTVTSARSGQIHGGAPYCLGGH